MFFPPKIKNSLVVAALGNTEIATPKDAAKTVYLIP